MSAADSRAYLPIDSATTVGRLPVATRRQVIARAGQLGCPVVEVEDLGGSWKTEYLCGVVVGFGRVAYDAFYCEMDTWLHEIAHGIHLASLGILGKFEGGCIPDSICPDEQRYVLPCQVALSYRLRGIGVQRQLKWMSQIDYRVFGANGEEVDVVTWWLREGRDRARMLQFPWFP